MLILSADFYPRLCRYRKQKKESFIYINLFSLQNFQCICHSSNEFTPLHPQIVLNFSLQPSLLLGFNRILMYISHVIYNNCNCQIH